MSAAICDAFKERSLPVLRKKAQTLLGTVAYNEQCGYRADKEEVFMKEGWSGRWKALLIWASGYLSFIAFAIVGGYVIVKSEDEELKKTAKQVFIITLIFTAISMFFTLYGGIGALSPDFSSSGAYVAYGVLQLIANIAKIIVYVVFALRAFFNAKTVAGESKAETGKEETTGGKAAEPTEEKSEAEDVKF